MLMQVPSRTLKLLRAGASLLRIVRSLGRDLYALAALEARLALSTVGAIAGLGMGFLALVATGWVLLVLALVAWIADRWMSLPGSLLVVGAAMLILSVPLALLVKRFAARLGFPETRRRIDEVVRG
jgi:hypothetical protein